MLSMSTIEIKDNGHIFFSNQIITQYIFSFLSHKLILTEAFVLRSFFKMLERYPVFMQLSPFISGYMSQYKASPSNGCIVTGVDQLVLNKRIEMHSISEIPKIEIYCSLVGKKNNERVSIKPFQFQNLLDITLCLGNLKHVIFGDLVDSLEFDTDFSLFEFIEAIVWEFSFHNAPDVCHFKKD